MQDFSELLKDTFQDIVQIGAGGGGQIFKAYHKRLEKEVVLKKLTNANVSAEERKAEMKILKDLKNDYIPQIFDFMEFGNDVFTVMEYIPGKSFAQLLSEKKHFSQKDISKWMLQLCQVVTYLHSQDPPIIHCDIKPANVMLTPKGDICLIDFNISSAKSEDEISAIGFSKGYAPVEQFAVVAKRLEEQLSRGTFSARGASADNTNGSVGTADDDRTDIANFDDDKTDIVGFDDDKTDIIGGDDDVTLITTEEAAPAVAAVSEPVVEKKRKRGKKNVVLMKSLMPTMKDEEWTQAKQAQEAAGGKLSIDERTDIYSVGATLFHIATGVKPAAFYEKHRSVSDVKENINGSIAYVIEKAMSFKPSDRFKSSKQMLKVVKNIGTVDKRYKSLVKRQVISTILLCVLIIASSGVMSYGKSTMGLEKEDLYASYVEKMDEALVDQQYEELEANYENAIGVFSQRFDAHYIMAMSLYSRKAYEDCIEFTMQLLQTEADVFPAEECGKLYYVVASAYFELEDYPHAVLYYEEALQRKSDEVLYYRDYAIALAYCGELDKAMEKLAVAKEQGLAGDSLSLLNGEIALLVGNYAECEDYLKECISETADDYVKLRAYSKLDDAYQKLYQDEEQYTAREALLQEALDILPDENHITLMERLAQVYINFSDVKDKEYYCEKAIEIFKDMETRNYATFVSRYNIAVLYEKMGAYDNALAQLTAMQEQYSNNYTIYKRMAFVELQIQSTIKNENRNYDVFKEYYDKALALYKENASGEDVEMLSLQQLYDDVVANGWFER